MVTIVVDKSFSLLQEWSRTRQVDGMNNGGEKPAECVANGVDCGQKCRDKTQRDTTRVEMSFGNLVQREHLHPLFTPTAPFPSYLNSRSQYSDRYAGSVRSYADRNLIWTRWGLSLRPLAVTAHSSVFCLFYYPKTVHLSFRCTILFTIARNASSWFPVLILKRWLLLPLLFKL